MILGQMGSLGVFGSETPSNIDQEQVLRIASATLKVEGNGQYFGFATRDNISILRFKVVDSYREGINLSNGYFDFENNGIDRVVIQLDNMPYYLTSDKSSITFSKENMIVRFGDLDIPHNFKGVLNVIFYVGNDPDGIHISNHTGRYVMMVNYQV